MPLMLTPARETAPMGILTGIPMNALSVTTFNIPEAMLRPLEQAFSHISQSKVLENLSCFLLYLSSSLCNSCHFLCITFRSRIMGEQKALLDISYSLSSFLEDVMKMAGIDIDPFNNHDKVDTQPDDQ